MTHTSGDAQSERHLNRRIAEQVSVVDLRVERARHKATDRSRRKVPISPPLVAMLRAHRATQEVERIAAANQWRDYGLVFASEFGTAVDPRNILRTIHIAAQKGGMSDIGVHTLRHSAAVAWLEAGVHIKAVADLLGHSSIAITGDIYGHTSDGTARAAVDGLAGRLGLLD